METRSAKRRNRLNPKSYEVSAEDRISKLPEEIVHQIFSFLPLECVARTCVLSKFWRYMWYSYPSLDLTTSSALNFYDGGFRSGADHMDRVLGLLEKHSDLTSLKFDSRTSVSGLRRLMGAAFKHNVQELDLEFSIGGCLNLPRCMVNSLSLRDLRLSARRCPLRLPPLNVMKNGFKSLGSLSLSGVEFGGDHHLPVDLFTGASFPSLTKLHLDKCDWLMYLRIQMPGLIDFSLGYCCSLQELDISVEKLKKLRVKRCFTVYRVSTQVKINAPFLESISWSALIPDEFVIGECDSLKEADLNFYLHSKDSSGSKMRSVCNFLKGISHCHRLGLESNFIEILSGTYPLAPSGSLVEWYRVFDRLESLQLTTTTYNTHKLASLFRCSPAVPEITIWIKFEYQRQVFWLPEKMYYWESQAQSLHSFLSHLKVVSIIGVSISPDEVIDLVEFLLKHGTVLQRLSLSNHQGSPMRKEIKSRVLGFSRASSSARIIFR